LVGKVLKAFQTDNLPVKLVARRSGHAAHDHHEGLAGLPGLGLSLFQAREPPVLDRRLLAPPKAPGLSRHRGGGQHDDTENQNTDKPTSHEPVLQWLPL
jgi:hypothetical protein